VSGPRYAALARRLLVQRDTSALPAPPPRVDERARAIATIEQAIAARRRHKRLLRVAFGSVAAAAALACVLGGSRLMARHGALASAPSPAGTGVQIVAHPVAGAGGANVVVSGEQAPLVEGRALPAGSRIVTPPNGRASLSFSTGTSVALGEGADLSIESIEHESGSQVLRLAGGFVDLHVAKLSPGQRFIVDTADSEVEVRGTRFRVGMAEPNAACGGGALTRVTVSEGVVVVRHGGVESRVAAGEEWPRGCAAPASAPLTVVAAGAKASASGPAPGAAAGAQGRAARGDRGGRSQASELAEQNDLYADASVAKRRGDVQGALGGFDRLLTKYPAGPLAESACVERMRLLRGVAPERASASARDYLARYPNGVARPEAEALVQAGAP
jgi:hypothetical protein